MKFLRLLQYRNQRCSSTKASNKLGSLLKIKKEEISEAGTWKKERIILGPQGPSIKVRDYSHNVLNFCANNYLGLASHPKVIEAAAKALKTHGAGLSSVRFICGTTDLHLELEEKIAKFHNREASILYGSCFDANGGIFEALLNEEDALLSDELNHASIIDGMRLCKAKKWKYQNGNIKDLRRCMVEAKDCRLKMVVSDGVFSMDGNICPLKDIVNLAQEFECLIFVDECHATGFIGKTGRGTEEYWGLPLPSVDIINSTFGKALGGAMGGYTVASKHVIDILRQRSRPYLFSNTLPPSVVASALQAIDLITESESGLLTKIQYNTAKFRTTMNQLGFTVMGDQSHPICPVMLGDAKLASIFAEEMLKKGIYVIGFSYPVVPKEKARIRVQLSAVHTEEQIDKLLVAFRSVGEDLGVIKT